MEQQDAYVHAVKEYMEQQDAYPLDDNAISQIAELQEQARSVQTCTQFVLNHFIRKHQLKGIWQLAENGRELVLQKSPVSQP